MKIIIALTVALTLIFGCIPVFPALAESTIYDGPNPYNITVSVKGDLTSARGIAWQTGKNYTASDLQIIEHSDPATADFSGAEVISGTYTLIGDLQTNAHHVDVTGLKAGTLVQGGTYYAKWVDPRVKMGDVDYDGVVDTTDLALLKKYLANKENPDADKVIYGDVNSDGDINTTDLAILKKILAGIYVPTDPEEPAEPENPDIDYEDPDIWTPPIGGEN